MEGGLGPEVKLPAGISVVGKWHRVGEDFVCSPPHHLAKDRPDAGFGTWLRIRGNKVELEVDRIRTTPVFYAMTPDGQKVCASPTFGEAADWLKSQGVAIELDTEQAAAYCLAGYTLGGKTLCPNIKTLLPGKKVTLAPGIEEVDTAEPFPFYEGGPPLTIEKAGDLIDDATTAVVKRFLDFTEGRPIMVPLSGGYDSRYLLTKLKQLGCDHVSAFTYGSAKSEDVQNAQKVAGALGVPWTFVEYNREKWASARESGLLGDFFSYVVNGVSSPQFQDIVALNELKQLGKITDDTVMMPGHSGDFITGNHRQKLQSSAPPIDLVFKRHFVLCGALDPLSQQIHSLARQALEKSGVRTDRDSEDIVEEWNCLQRQGLNIVNSIRLEDYLGLDWGMPMWDREFYDVWKEIPLDLRMNRAAFLHAAKRETEPMLGNMTLGGAKPWQKRIPRGLRKFLGKSKTIYKLANKAIKKSDPFGWYVLYEDEKWADILERSRTISHLIACETLLIQCDRYGWEPPAWVAGVADRS